MEAFFSNAAAVIWLILAVVFVVAETITVALISVWFAIGAVLAMIAALFGGAVWLQILIFIASSGILILLTKPLSEKLVNKKAVKTNADRVVGQAGTVLQPIDNLKAEGQVRVMEQIWSARSVDGTPIAAGTPITVKEIQGVKLLVEPAQQEKER